MTTTKKDVESKEFPMPTQCGIAVKIGKEWHTCNKPAGHDGVHECKHYTYDNKEELYDRPTENAQRVRFLTPQK